MSTVFLIGSIQAFFLSLMLRWKAPTSFANRLLVIWMALLGINLLGSYLGITGTYEHYPYLFGLDASMPVLYGPIIYWYVASQVHPAKFTPVKLVPHLFPYLFFTTYLLIKTHIPDVANRYEHIKGLMLEPDAVILSLQATIHLSLLIYSALTIWLIRGHINRIPNVYSFTEGVNMRWILLLVWAMLGVSAVIIMGIVFSDILGWVDLDIKGLILYGLFSLIPFYLMAGAVSERLFDPFVGQAQLVENKHYEPMLTEVDINQYCVRLEALMKESKPYLNPKLTINDLADQMGLHSKVLSYIINKGTQMTFFNFINTYRVSEVKSRLNDPRFKHLTLLGVGLDCGFNSKSAFNDVFKKLTGLTPSAYHREMSESGKKIRPTS